MDLSNPLYVHTSYGPGSLPVQEKLIGAQNYRSWKRSMEIGLSTKRKLGFVKGTIPKPAVLPVTTENSVARATNATNIETWETCNNLELDYELCLFSISIGSRKYNLSKDVFRISQQGASVSEYYTKMKCIWEELDSLSALPRLTTISPELSVFLTVVERQKEEQRLFQFLNGLDDCYSSQMSQLLLINPLPSVENACAVIQQEKSRKDVFNSGRTNQSKSVQNQSRSSPKRTATNVTSGSNTFTFTSEQFENFTMNVLKDTKPETSSGDCINDELEFVADHMTPYCRDMINAKILEILPKITLPNGDSSKITQIGQVRLGHISVTKMKHVQCSDTPLLNENHTTCLTYPMDKLTKLPYAYSESCSSAVFDLIHMDTWGPYKVPTHAFFKFVKLQFSTKVKCIRLDNALEFVKGPCALYLACQGIEHQTTCVEKPQQNGRVERKQRHILEVARALRLQASIPLKFWGDCITTTTYLINRIPSSVLNNKTPYEKLLNKVPDYSHLRVFGCFAVATNPSRVIDKFSLRGVPCVFIGYHAHQKGYKLYNLQTHASFKYTLEMLQDAGVLNTRPYKLPMDPNLKLQADVGTPLQDPDKSKKQGVISKSSAEAEYKAMTITCCKITWLTTLLKDLGLKDLHPVTFHCDSQAAIHIAANLVFHARTKHIEVYCHYVRDQVKDGQVKPIYLHTSQQLADVFTKVLTTEQHLYLLNKLGLSTLDTTQLEGWYKDKGDNCTR
nr:cysteamine dioxygenase [Tanacetum cinerariifolium]